MKRVCAMFVMLIAGWAGLFALVPLAAEDENALGALRDDAGATKPVTNDQPAQPGGAKTYTIASGDWLSKIAERFYGSADKWPLIYNANKDKLGPNPDLIYPGVQISIPADDGKTPSTPPTGGTGTGPGGGTPNPGGNSGPFAQQRPVDHGRVSSNFGPRNIGPISGHYHYGLDIGIPNGTPVKATGPGKVIFAGNQGGYGKLVKVAHADGTVTLFAHLQSFNVRVGEQVGAGQQLAQSNNSGNSTGPHLHFGVEKNGKLVNPRDDFNFPPKGSSF